jgi:PAS domain S-box-containing protein
MAYDFSPLCYTRFISGLFALFLIGVLWRHRESKGVVYLMLFELAAAIWAIGDGFESAAPVAELKIHWSQFTYIGISTCSGMFLLFALSYAHHLRYTRTWAIVALMVIPFITIIIAFTNSYHKLLWARTEFYGGNTSLIYYYGHWFWFQAFYQYAVLILGIIILLLGAMKVYSRFRTQFWIIIAGAIFPFVSSIAYVFKLFPVKGFDPTPVSFIITGFIVTLGIFWFRMFNIMPIARKQAVDNLRDGMLVADASGMIVDANAAFYHMTGYKSGQIIGKHATNFFSDIRIDISKFTDDNDYALETQFDLESGPEDIEVKYHSITDTNQKLLGGIYMLTNITTRKMILDAIADSNKRRKYELIEKEKLILDLDAYARSVAHDLKNPLGTLVGLTDLIRERLAENDISDVEEMVGIVSEQSRKMIRIIDDLLMLSRIRKDDIVKKPIKTEDILDDVFRRLKGEIERYNAVIERPVSWPMVMGHPQWIEEVWVNLLSNALKYGGNPPVIKLGYDMTGSGSCRFWIQDNGNGLPGSSLKKIFRDFERLGKKDSDGYGLGLPIVKRIFEKLVGEIVATSSNRPGEGCVFSFTLDETGKASASD